MNVRELKELLDQCPANAEVLVSTDVTYINGEVGLDSAPLQKVGNQADGKYVMLTSVDKFFTTNHILSKEPVD